MMVPTADVLDAFAKHHGTDKSSQYHDYCPAYADLLRALPSITTLLEFGVFKGASLEMWRDTLPTTFIIGVDVNLNSALRDFGPRVKLILGSATDADLVPTIASLAPEGFNLIIDDASHLTSHQIITASLYWPLVAPGGAYVIEDACCGWWPEYADNHTIKPLPDWIADRVDDVMLHGAKAHGYARRFETVAAHNPLSRWEQTLASLTVTNGLIILRKRSA